MTNAQMLLVGINTPSAPGTQKMELYAPTGDALYVHSLNVGAWVGYETNFTFGSFGTLQGAGIWVSNPSAGYTSLFSQSTLAATVAANVNFSSVWMANYNSG